MARTLGGVVVESGRFPWDNGKFPGMTEPSPGYHGVRFYETFGDFGFTMRCRMETLRVYGAALSPMSAWQILQGVETLPLRMERHCSNALAVASYLRDDPRVGWVNYPGLPEHPQHALMQRQMRGASGLLSFGVEGGAAAGVRFIESAQFMSHLVNIGDTRTLISHPASTTHRQLDDDAAARRRRPARHGAHLGRAGAHRRHPVGHRPGTRRGQRLIPVRDQQARCWPSASGGSRRVADVDARVRFARVQTPLRARRRYPPGDHTGAVPLRGAALRCLR